MIVAKQNNKHYRPKLGGFINRTPRGLVLSFLLTASQSMYAAQESAVFQHNPQECKQCHSEQTYIDLLQQNNCETCHGENIPIPPLALSESTSNTNKRAANKHVMGMRLSQFSAESRMGEQPNRMTTIPDGKFIRGTNQRFPDEGPQYTAMVAGFKIDIYEVTNLQYKHFMDVSQHKSPNHFENRTYPEGKADHPVVFVSWYDANEYCQWAGKRLPTDIEWEKAARGTDGRTYAWGNIFKETMANTPQRWSALHTSGGTTPVGAFPQGKSVYGLYDVSGNVWEWTSSWYKAYPGNKRKVENYGEIYKTLKGGSWWDCSFYKCGFSAPLYNRSFFYRKTKNKSFGFRCAKDI